jgi:hypothetical protein
MRSITIELTDLEAHSVSMAALESKRTDQQWVLDAVRSSVMLYEHLGGQVAPRIADDAFKGPL